MAKKIVLEVVTGEEVTGWSEAGRKAPWSVLTNYCWSKRQICLTAGWAPKKKLRSSPSDIEGKESACNVGDPGSIPGLGRSPGEGNGNPLQYSCLESLMDSRAWRVTVHGVAKSRTWLSDFTFFSFTFFLIAQWLGVCPQLQGTQVWSLVWEDPPATRQLNLHDTTTKPTSSRARAPQQEKPLPREASAAQLESSLHSPQLEKAHA